MYHCLNAIREILKNIIMQTPVMTVKDWCIMSKKLVNIYLMVKSQLDRSKNDLHTHSLIKID
jgi:hypothetical protein